MWHNILIMEAIYQCRQEDECFDVVPPWEGDANIKNANN